MTDMPVIQEDVIHVDRRPNDKFAVELACGHITVIDAPGYRKIESQVDDDVTPRLICYICTNNQAY